jgi:AcrR family transcriptional regulator
MTRNVRSRHRSHTHPDRAAARQERRAELLAAADRVIRRDGPGTSMTAIAAEAGVTKPILYKHFGDKGGLYQALAEDYVQAILGSLRDALASSEDPRTLIESTIDAYLTFIEREREVYVFLMHRAVSERPEAQATVADFIQQLGDEIAITLRDELRRFGVDSGGAEPWAHGIVGMVYLAGDRWLTHATMTRKTLVEYLTNLLWTGFSQLPVTAARVEGA